MPLVVMMLCRLVSAVILNVILGRSSAATIFASELEFLIDCILALLVPSIKNMSFKCYLKLIPKAKVHTIDKRNRKGKKMKSQATEFKVSCVSVSECWGSAGGGLWNSNRWWLRVLSGQIQSVSNLKKYLGSESCLFLSVMMLNEGNMFSFLKPSQLCYLIHLCTGSPQA